MKRNPLTPRRPHRCLDLAHSFTSSAEQKRLFPLLGFASKGLTSECAITEVLVTAD